MDAWMVAIGGLVALQALQTIQIAIVGRRIETVAKSLRPPPPAAAGPTCAVCGLPHHASELDLAGLCVECRTGLSGGPSSAFLNRPSAINQRWVGKAIDAALRSRRARAATPERRAMYDRLLHRHGDDATPVACETKAQAVPRPSAAGWQIECAECGCLAEPIATEGGYDGVCAECRSRGIAPR